MPPAHEVPIEFLVVGNDDALVRSVRDTLKAGKVGNRVDTVADAEAAVKYLLDAGDRLQEIVVLALPEGGAPGILPALDAQGPTLANVPVIGIARDEAGIDRDLQVDGWLTLPFSVAQVLGVLRDLKGFGLTIVRGVAA